MTTTTPTNRPIATLRDGSLKASVWGNPGESGVRYNVDLVRSYTDEQGAWRDTRSLSGGELLRAARLLERAYERVLDLRAADKPADDEEAPA
jgi:hypothetical protein